MMRKKRNDEIETRDEPRNDEEESAQTPGDESNATDDSAEDDLVEAIAELERQRDEAVEQYQRALADYRNYQRRSVQNEIAAAERARQELVRDLIPVLDNFDLALEHAEGGDPKQIAQGIRMVREGLMQTLAQRNLRRIDAQPGDEFDPNQHEAMMMEPSDEFDANHVVRLIQVGYALGDTVLRPAKVSIAQPTENEASQARGDTEVKEEEATGRARDHS